MEKWRDARDSWVPFGSDRSARDSFACITKPSRGLESSLQIDRAYTIDGGQALLVGYPNCKAKGLTKMNIGDTVKLKSGGPVMTLCTIPQHSDVEAECLWFKEDERKTGTFPLAALHAVAVRFDV